MTFAELEPILLHPLTRLTAQGVATLLVGPLVWLLTAGAGVDAVDVPGLRALRWSRLAGALAALFALAGFAALWFPGMADQALVAADVLARITVGLMCLFAAAWVGHVRAALAQDRAAQAEAARHVGHVWLVGGAAAAVAMIETGAALLVVLALGLAAARSLVTRGEPARRVRGWLLDLAAGITLRERLTTDVPVPLGDLRVVAAPGLLTTEVDGAGGRRSLANTLVLEALDRVVAPSAPHIAETVA